ncbi:MAG: LuxR C-terminal-related transcriptional regulator [Actinobacteria bacterium]|nr:LuxR C-terminal-related transcriptional regulator [Actinomycetota bacterium]
MGGVAQRLHCDRLAGMLSSLERARHAFACRGWAEACVEFAAAVEEQASLTADDHEARAVAAYLIGADDVCEKAFEAAHRAALAAGASDAAARCAFWLALSLMLRGRIAQAGGWLARAQGVVDDAGIECAASGYLLIPGVLGALGSGDPATACDLALQAFEVGHRYDEADLRAFGLLGHGQALIALGDVVAGAARFDEAMVAVTAGEVGPVTSGIVYCAVVIECLRVYDLPRATEWTAALSAWCDSQPDLVPYRGQCLVHRSQIHQAAGRWREAMTTAEAASRVLTDPPHPALGLACYQEAELHRLVGDLDQAEAGYQHASREGHHPMPGLALLELARGDAAAAATTIRRVLQEATNPLDGPALLAAAADILPAAGDLAGARAAADELAEVAAGSPSPVLRAMADQAVGTVLVAEGDPAGALRQLRSACRTWQSMRMPYEAARTAAVLGRACAALGDSTAAALELRNARDAFADLGARPDLERTESLLRGVVGASAPDAAGLSDRELEVLAQLAAGRTNREIAAALVISQHTVRRHVENIFTKLGVSTRTAATAYAYEQGLLSRPGAPSG